MKYLKTYSESIDIKTHLKERGINPDDSNITIDNNDVYFYIYNLSGQMVGYQKYNPLYPKQLGKGKDEDKTNVKYYTFFGDEGIGKKIGTWGIESLKPTDKYVFIVEGVFDAARIHQCGYSALAVFCNDPAHLKSWFNILPQIKIVIYDNDELDNDPGGKKLIKYGDYAFTVPEVNDINDLTPSEAQIFLDDIIEKIEEIK